MNEHIPKNCLICGKEIIIICNPYSDVSYCSETAQHYYFCIYYYPDIAIKTYDCIINVKIEINNRQYELDIGKNQTSLYYYDPPDYKYIIAVDYQMKFDFSSANKLKQQIKTLITFS